MKEQQDTDPSTPGALRGVAPTDPTPTPTPASLRVSTDPGLGPPSQPAMPVAPRPRSTPPLGIVVPASSAVSPRKDSVELLLDGMKGPQPERPKTTPRTDGEASAAYHAEHGLRPARTSPDQEPSVVVERPAQAATGRIERSKVQAVIERADAKRRTMETTAVLPQQVGPRIVVALAAAAAVIMVVFLLLHLARMGVSDSPSPPIVLPATTITLPASAAAPVAAPTPTRAPEPAPPSPASVATGTEAPAATGEPPAAATRAPASAVTTAPASTAPRPKATRPASSGDMGEFKTTIH